MSTPKMMVNAVDPDTKWLYRVGGISALLVGLGYIVIIPLYLVAGIPTTGGEAKLIYLGTDGHSVYPGRLGAVPALKEINRSAISLAVVSLALFAALELAITSPM